jgi:hypothetical protein
VAVAGKEAIKAVLTSDSPAAYLFRRGQIVEVILCASVSSSIQETLVI